ncbi:MAG: non-ribosomal peptide synthetase, partial [Verrucomicrobia bacterium]
AGWRAPKEFKILCGGEFLPRELADQLLEDGASLWNLYGPTETTIWSSIAKVGPEKGPVPIGRPIANTQIYILDSHLQPVPLEVHGELYIGGDGLARGYLNRPELTAERFVVIPFSDQAGSRLYRTGDLARYRPDGEMEFIGRVDNQVKIRGYRVELGEIEATLNQHVAVKQCVVVARERESSEEKELVGYIVPNQGSVASVSDLRSLLRQKLPDYMIPSAFVFLNALPLTPNGKVDRSKLPPPGYSRPSLDQGFVEPRSEIEELVAQVWREVLKLDKIGVYDNFFELGGHSLLATRVVARLRTNFDIDLPLRKLFELPTVAALAEHVDFLRRNQSGVSVPPIMPVPRDGPLPLSFSQQRLWFLHKLNPEFTAYNIPAVFDIKGQLNVPALERALNEIIMRHESLRTSIAETDGNPVQQIVPSVTFTLPVVDLSHLPEDQAAAEVQRLSIDDARKPYDIQNAPLMRAKLLRLGEQDHVLILNFHHIVSDGSSLVIFYQEVAGLYKASLEEIDVSLPPLQVQYVDYAVWQHDWFQGEACESQLAYWKGQLSDVSPLNLPTDDERPLTQTFRGARRSKMLSVELIEELKDLSRRAGVTRFMTLLAAFNLLLSRHTGQEDIVVGSTIAGRNRPELDGVIGFFINALALRTDLSGNPSFIDLLKRVREVCLDAYTHQDLPFEKVVEELNPQRDFSRNPLFQVLFNWADVSERVLTLPGCEIVKL